LALLKNESHLTTKDLVSHIDKTDPLPISRQAELLGISRGSIYYEPRPIDELTLTVMRKIDEVYTKRPYYGSRRMAHEVGNQLEMPINRKRIQGLMAEMGLEAIYPKPHLSLNGKPHPIYPYLLRGIDFVRPNQVWGTDITFIRLEKGFVYLTAFLDWFSRYVLSWEISNTLDFDFCLEAAEKALKYGLPEITNSDQGTQYTSSDYTGFWETKNVKISMDGRGRAMDNIFTERLWRSLKYEEVYLKNYQTVEEAKLGIGAYFEDYNYGRLHESLGYKTPAKIYFEGR